MNYSFKRSSGIYIIKDGYGHRISALSDFSISQTIAEKTLNRRNLFNRFAPKIIINRSKNVGSGSIELYFTNNCPILGILMETLDFTYNYNNTFNFDNIFSTEPKYVGLSIIDSISGSTINIDKIYITNMDVQCSPTNINKITFGFIFNEYDNESCTAYLNEAVIPNYPIPSYIDLRILNTQISSVKSAAFTITRNIRWLSTGATQFNIGSVASSTAPIVTEYNITALATANDNLDSNTFKSLVPIDSDVVLGNNSFFIMLPEARITTRKEPSEVFTVNFDIKHQSLSPVLIGGTYNGYIN